MIRICSAVAIGLATFLVCCNADPHQEQDGIDATSSDRFEAGDKARNIQPLGNMVRQIREAHQFSRNFGRHYDYLSPFGTRSLAPFEYGYYGEGLPKRNFDEIDRSNLDTFMKKRNFDEIDQSSMPFPYKRIIPGRGSNYLDYPVSSFDKKRYGPPEHPMDEIDLSQFPIGSKRTGFPLR